MYKAANGSPVAPHDENKIVNDNAIADGNLFREDDFGQRPNSYVLPDRSESNCVSLIHCSQNIQNYLQAR